MMVGEVANWIWRSNTDKRDQRPGRQHGFGYRESHSMVTVRLTPQPSGTQSTTLGKNRALTRGAVVVMVFATNSSNNHPLMSAHPGGAQACLGDGSGSLLQ